jgi:hypothetical protein
MSFNFIINLSAVVAFSAPDIRGPYLKKISQIYDIQKMKLVA